MRSSASSTWRISLRSSWNRAPPDNSPTVSAFRSRTQSSAVGPVTSSSHRYRSSSGPSGRGQPPVVAVANRLPVQHGDGGWQLSPGGLVTALRPVMTTRSGAWVGWDGGTKGTPFSLPDFSAQLRPVSLSASQVRNYYHGFANATLWPLLHDGIEKPHFERSWWDAYRQANLPFAGAPLPDPGVNPRALACVHGYHLMLVPHVALQRPPVPPLGLLLRQPCPS